MSDLWVKTFKKGTRWYANFRLPWRKKQSLNYQGTDKPQDFDTEFQAHKAATDTVFKVLADRTNGFCLERVGDAKAKAEALFKGGEQ